ncbi:hypothetical protein C6P45_000709 [Maudiozyma exigua]|uniref:AB hydrolase-1 domain-containing protein n=1 Tax=Maudiozyma exigua TaxID=34358 RepID=A0A9P7B8M4_MAUEX|nr:hypothetical protein C6P45_000709 [Kazachstania exigua]
MSDTIRTATDTKVQDACSLNGQPLSNRSVKDIIESFTDGLGLAAEVTKSRLDFRTKFIAEHESYRSIQGTEIRVCHNLQECQDRDSIEIDCYIHGLGGNLEQFEPLLRLDDISGRYFISMDLPGFGKSQDCTTYDMNIITDTIYSTWKNIINDTTNDSFDLLNCKINIIGHSMGCYIALHLFQKLSQEEPDINSLILMAPPKINIPQLRKGYTLTQFGLYTLSLFPAIFDYYRTKFDQSKGLQSSGIRDFFHNDDPNDINLLYRKLWQYQNNIQIKSRSIIGYLRNWEPLNWDVINETVSMYRDSHRLRIMILGGDGDHITPYEGVQQFFNAFTDNKDNRLECLKDCGHNICFDAPEEICSIFQNDIFQK